MRPFGRYPKMPPSLSRQQDFLCIIPPVPSSRHRLSYNDCLEDKGEKCQKCPVLYSVRRYCCAQRYAHMSSSWHCVRWDPAPPPAKGTLQSLSFWPMSTVATVACLSYCWALVILLFCNLCSILFSVLLFTCTHIRRNTDNHLLWSPYVIGQTIIFSSCFFFFFFLLLFFPRLISAVGDWMSTILRHMVWS